MPPTNAKDGADSAAELMRSFRNGDQDAGRALVELFYPELRRLAASHMKRERLDHTLQPTALVNQLYLELIKIRTLGQRDYEQDQERAAFLGLAGRIMKRMLIHHARPLSRRVERVDIGTASEPRSPGVQALYEVEDTLARLGDIDPVLRAVVEMKVFAGMTGEDIAETLGCSRRTVASHWNFALHWLQKEWARKV